MTPQKLLKHVIGMKATDAVKYIRSLGLGVRVVSADCDGQQYPCDPPGDRFTLTVANGIVTAATIA